MLDHQRISETLVELADTLVLGFDGIDFLHTPTERCVQLLGVDAAGILLIDQWGTLSLVAASTEQTRLLELFQLQNEQGPCLDCYHSGQGVACADLTATPQQWPRFAAVAREQGFAAVQAVPMKLREQILGALNLFRCTPDAIPAEATAVAQSFANVATISILQLRALWHSVTDQVIELRVAMGGPRRGQRGCRRSVCRVWRWWRGSCVSRRTAGLRRECAGNRTLSA